MKCECKIKFGFDRAGNVVGGEVIHCPLHEKAEKLRNALENMLETFSLASNSTHPEREAWADARAVLDEVMKG